MTMIKFEWPSTQQFLDWARTMPADKSYIYSDGSQCPIFQFMQASGFDVIYVSPYDAEIMHNEEVIREFLPDGWNDAVIEGYLMSLRSGNQGISTFEQADLFKTFGGLVQQLEKLSEGITS